MYGWDSLRSLLIFVRGKQGPIVCVGCKSETPKLVVMGELRRLLDGNQEMS